MVRLRRRSRYAGVGRLGSGDPTGGDGGPDPGDGVSAARMAPNLRPSRTYHQRAWQLHGASPPPGPARRGGQIMASTRTRRGRPSRPGPCGPPAPASSPLPGSLLCRRSPPDCLRRGVVGGHPVVHVNARRKPASQPGRLKDVAPMPRQPASPHDAKCQPKPQPHLADRTATKT